MPTADMDPPPRMQGLSTGMTAATDRDLHYRGDSKLRTHTVLGSYGRDGPRGIGPS